MKVVHGFGFWYPRYGEPAVFYEDRCDIMELLAANAGSSIVAVAG